MLKRLSMVSASSNTGAPTTESVDTMGPLVEAGGHRLSIARASTAGPSIQGLLLSKKFAKRLSTKALSKRDISSASGIHKLEPTYRMEPKRQFSSCLVEKCIKDILEDRLENFRYNPKFSANIIKVLSEEIKDRVKIFCFDRYKIVCIITLAQRNDQGLMVGSRSSWDKKNDNYACYTFMNPHIVCSASVYGVYRE